MKSLPTRAVAARNYAPPSALQGDPMTLSMSQIATVRRSISFDNARAWLLVIATVILLGVVYMGQASQAAITGQRIHDKQEKLDRILRENAQLEADIAVLMAPSRIE